MAAVAGAGLLLILVLLWPSLYHYETVRLDGKDYPLRINRLTSRAQYSDGRQWLDPPLPAAALPVTALPAEPLEQAAPPPPPVAPFVAAPAAEPPAVATPPVKTVTMPREKPTPGPAIETAPAADRTRAKAVPKGRYGIQVGAYPETAKAEAQANALRAKYPTARVEVIRIEGKGPWYRVLVGRFENRDDALRYLKDHRIGEAYPGSFVQTSTRP
jgi:cell division protein FtsN